MKHKLILLGLALVLVAAIYFHRRKKKQEEEDAADPGPASRSPAGRETGGGRAGGVAPPAKPGKQGFSILNLTNKARDVASATAGAVDAAGSVRDAIGRIGGHPQGQIKLARPRRREDPDKGAVRITVV